MKTIVVGVLGAGRACQLHVNAYKKVSGIDVRLKTIFDADNKKAKEAKEKYGFESLASSAKELLNDKEIDVIDICTPPYTHKDFVIQVLKADKHVICEKPLTGYFGKGVDNKKKMYEAVSKDIAELEKALASSKKKFFYAENFIYAPAVTKAAEIIKAKKSKILYAKGEESLAGSSSPVAGLWEKSGGGTLLRVGCHPLSAIIYLKKVSNASNKVSNVIADVSQILPSLSEYEHRHIKAKPVDVEDHATLCLTFSDNTKAVVMATDSRLGGSINYVELYCNDAVIKCNLTMNDAMSTYLLDEEGLKDVEISEMLSTKCGWNNPFVSDEIMRGYVDEMQDFMECIRDNKEPRSNFEIAKETILTIYKAYMF